MSGIIGETGKSGVIGTIPSYASLNNQGVNAFNYIKYPNGVLICWTDYINSASSSNVTWTFPHAFKSGTNPSVSGGSKDSATRFCVTGVNGQANGATGWTFHAYELSVGSAGSTEYVSRSSSQQLLCAVGRWK